MTIRSKIKAALDILTCDGFFLITGRGNRPIGNGPLLRMDTPINVWGNSSQYIISCTFLDQKGPICKIRNPTRKIQEKLAAINAREGYEFYDSTEEPNPDEN